MYNRYMSIPSTARRSRIVCARRTRRISDVWLWNEPNEITHRSLELLVSAGGREIKQRAFPRGRDNTAATR